MKFQAAVKWTGSRICQAQDIIQYFPEYINTYYEPFCGGCSVIYQLLLSQKIYHTYINRIVCSDINGDLIDLWRTIKNDTKGVIDEYYRMWTQLNDISNRQDKRKYYEEIRDEFNQTRSPYLYYFLMRTCTNGLPRYNKFGNFNQTFHLTRNGMHPDKIKKVLTKWGEILKNNNVNFRRCDYTEILKDVDDGDFIYLDPPYKLTRSTGRYFGKIDFDDMFDRLRILNDKGIKYAMTFGDVNEDIKVPSDCYKNVYSIKSTVSGFRSTSQNLSKKNLFENLYIN